MVTICPSIVLIPRIPLGAREASTTHSRAEGMRQALDQKRGFTTRITLRTWSYSDGSVQVCHLCSRWGPKARLEARPGTRADKQELSQDSKQTTSPSFTRMLCRLLEAWFRP